MTKKTNQSFTILQETTTVRREKKSVRLSKRPKRISREVIATTDLMPRFRKILKKLTREKKQNKEKRNGEMSVKREKGNIKRLNRGSMMGQVS